MSEATRSIKVITEASGLVRFKDAETARDLLGIRFVADTPRPPRGLPGTLLRMDEDTGEQVFERVTVTEIINERRPW